MGMVTTREQLKQYALRNLGAPVIEINVDDDQLEDRLDEALEYWHLYHNEGVEKFYLKHKMRASRLHLDTTNAADFQPNTIVVGVTSGARARLIVEAGHTPVDNELVVRVDTDGPEFIGGETIVWGSVAAALATNPVTLGELDLKYFVVDDWVYGVTRIIPFSGAQTSKSMFDLQYQLRLNDLYDLTSTSIVYYKQVMSHLSLLDLELNGKPILRFNRMQNRVHLDINWDSDIAAGEYVIVECYRAIDPDKFNRVYREPWLKHYVTALYKRAWATNLKKFQGVQLPGGVTIDGQGLYQEAMAEMKDLEDELVQRSAPCEFYLG